MTEAVFQWVTVFFLLVNGIGVPVLVFMSGRHDKMLQAQDKIREEKFTKLDIRLTHLDECVDDVREIVVGKSVTREDFTVYRAEIAETLNRMRVAISSETGSLNERIMRLENIQFGRPS